MAVTRDAVVNYLRDECKLDTSGLQDDTQLFSTNLLDSFTMVDLIIFLEKAGGIRIGATEVSMDNLDSVGSILAFCERKAAS